MSITLWPSSLPFPLIYGQGHRYFTNTSCILVCDICGDAGAQLVCAVCDSKQLCRQCDDRWHQHPKRKNHDRNKIAVDDTATSKSNEEVYHSAEEIVPPPRTYPMSPKTPPTREFPVPPAPHYNKPFPMYVNVGDPQTPAAVSVLQSIERISDQRGENSVPERAAPARPYESGLNNSSAVGRRMWVTD